MTISDAPHGRSRYTRGCRCGTCKQANREYQRRRRAKHLAAVPPGDQQPAEFPDGRVTRAIRNQFENTAVALERPGLLAIAIRLAQLLDNDSALPQHASAAHRLTEILGTLSQTSQRRGRLSLVRGMTGDTGKGSTSRAKPKPANGPAV